MLLHIELLDDSVGRALLNDKPGLVDDIRDLLPVMVLHTFCTDHSHDRDLLSEIGQVLVDQIGYVGLVWHVLFLEEPEELVPKTSHLPSLLL
jgi:hypothetical protein